MVPYQGSGTLRTLREDPPAATASTCWVEAGSSSRYMRMRSGSAPRLAARRWRTFQWESVMASRRSASVISASVTRWAVWEAMALAVARETSSAPTP